MKGYTATYPWEMVALVGFPLDVDFKEGICRAKLYFYLPAKIHYGSVAVRWAFYQDDANVPSWESAGDPPIPLEGYEPDTVHSIFLGTFPLNYGEAGAFGVWREMRDVEDTAASEEAIMFIGIDFDIEEVDARTA